MLSHVDSAALWLKSLVHFTGPMKILITAYASFPFFLHSVLYIIIFFIAHSFQFIENMLKFIAILLAITFTTINSDMILGGYTDRPDLIKDKEVEELVGYATKYLTTTQNLYLSKTKINRVQTQVVAGTNYKIDFSDGSMTCQAVIYVRFDGTTKVTSAECSPI